MAAAERLAAHACGDRRHRRCVWQRVEADHAHDLFDEVFLDLNIKPPARWRDGHAALGFGECQPKAPKHISALLLAHGHAGHLSRTCHAQHHGLGFRQAQHLIIDRPADCVFPAADVEDELGDALDMLDRALGVHTTLETVAGVGREVVAARAPGHGFWPPESGLHIDIAGGIADGCRVATHDAGQRLHHLLSVVFISDNAHLRVQRHGVAVE